MALNPEFEPHRPDNDLVDRLKKLVSAIEEGLESGQSMEREINEVNSLTGRSTTPYEFRSYSGSTSLESFVIQLCLAQSKPSPGVTKDDLVEIVTRLQESECPDWEDTYYLSFLQANCPDPEVSDLLFWSDKELTAEQIVERAFEYQAQPMPARRNQDD